ncbi:MAG: hypothetical protein RLZZ182_617 [Pseudomonadota bacterium]|jgi:hypothetical protein
MTLSYLLFDHSQDTEGVHTFEAMASVGPTHWPQVQAEVARVLAWAHGQFRGERGPLDDGGDWDYELQGLQEVATAWQWQFNERTGAIEGQLGAPGQPRHTATLTLTGLDAFADAFLQAFPADD